MTLIGSNQKLLLNMSVKKVYDTTAANRKTIYQYFQQQNPYKQATIQNNVKTRIGKNARDLLDNTTTKTRVHSHDT